MKFIEREPEPTFTTVYADNIRETQAWINMSDIYSHYAQMGPMSSKPAFIDYLCSCDSAFNEYLSAEDASTLTRVTDVFDVYSDYIIEKELN